MRFVRTMYVLTVFFNVGMMCTHAWNQRPIGIVMNGIGCVLFTLILAFGKRGKDER